LAGARHAPEAVPALWTGARIAGVAPGLPAAHGHARHDGKQALEITDKNLRETFRPRTNVKTVENAKTPDMDCPAFNNFQRSRGLQEGE